MQYTQVLNLGGLGVHSPADTLFHTLQPRTATRCTARRHEP